MSAQHGPDGSDTLQQRIDARRAVIEQRLRRRGGRLSAADAAELQGLQTLLALQPKAPAPAGKGRAPLIAAFALTLIVVSLLLFQRTGRTPIDLDAAASALHVTVPVAQPLTRTMALAGLRAAGLQRADAATPPGGIVQLRAGDAACGGSLTLEPLLLPAGARLRLRGAQAPTRLQLSLTAPGTVLRLTQTACAGQATSLTLVAGPEETDLEFELPAGAALAFATSLAVSELGLDEVELLTGDGASHVQRVSTLRSGTLHLAALGDRVLTLRRGEMLTIAPARAALRELALGDGQLTFRLAGEVTGLSRGEGDGARSLMPTWLEWLRSNQALSLLWGAVLYAFGLTATLWRWWSANK